MSGDFCYGLKSLNLRDFFYFFIFFKNISSSTPAVCVVLCAVYIKNLFFFFPFFSNSLLFILKTFFFMLFMPPRWLSPRDGEVVYLKTLDCGGKGSCVKLALGRERERGWIKIGLGFWTPKGGGRFWTLKQLGGGSPKWHKTINLTTAVITGPFHLLILTTSRFSSSRSARCAALRLFLVHLIKLFVGYIPLFGTTVTHCKVSIVFLVGSLQRHVLR